jgi:uncharacterized membrane protein
VFLSFLSGLLFANGLLCGVITYNIRLKTWHWLTNYISTAISSVIWLSMLKWCTSSKLLFLSVLFEVAFNFGYVVMIAYLGEQITARNLVGAALAIAGVVLMS